MYPGYDVFCSIFSRRFWRQILPSVSVVLLLMGGSIYKTFLIVTRICLNDFCDVFPTCISNTRKHEGLDWSRKTVPSIRHWGKFCNVTDSFKRSHWHPSKLTHFNWYFGEYSSNYSRQNTSGNVSIFKDSNDSLSNVSFMLQNVSQCMLSNKQYITWQ